MKNEYGKLLKEKKITSKKSAIERQDQAQLAQFFYKKSKKNKNINYYFLFLSLMSSIAVIIFFNLFYGIILLGILFLIQFIFIEPLKDKNVSKHSTNIVIPIKVEDKWNQTFNYLNKNLHFIDIELLNLTNITILESFKIIERDQLQVYETFDFYKNIDYLYEYINKSTVNFDDQIVQNKFIELFKSNALFFKKYYELLKDKNNTSVIQSIEVNKILTENKINKLENQS